MSFIVTPAVFASRREVVTLPLGSFLYQAGDSSDDDWVEQWTSNQQISWTWGQDYLWAEGAPFDGSGAFDTWHGYVTDEFYDLTGHDYIIMDLVTEIDGVEQFNGVLELDISDVSGNWYVGFLNRMGGGYSVHTGEYQTVNLPVLYIHHTQDGYWANEAWTTTAWPAGYEDDPHGMLECRAEIREITITSFKRNYLYVKGLFKDKWQEGFHGTSRYGFPDDSRDVVWRKNAHLEISIGEEEGTDEDDAAGAWVTDEKIDLTDFDYLKGSFETSYQGSESLSVDIGNLEGLYYIRWHYGIQYVYGNWEEYLALVASSTQIAHLGTFDARAVTGTFDVAIDPPSMGKCYRIWLE